LKDFVILTITFPKTNILAISYEKYLAALLHIQLVGHAKFARMRLLLV